ncbi:xanthine dehydrogenase/oxidase isoform X2 [Folsomia candida]|uniref:xanthine dehydrogenase/oxidase isoform X2 n=1 Tax=Folsomia candida TaxID=158441 RepID=UPI001604B0C7|nr:xanthine dehydrogenase/oxidase isoform X2 [Folsomia candida]
MAWMHRKRDTHHPFLLLVNGKLIRDESIDPAWSLAFYLRENHIKGVKVGCNQGGCGACTVLISRYYKEEDQFRHYSANACITPIASVHGSHIMTVEYLSDAKENTCHVIQDAIVKGCASQCGFCTPGMIMSLLAMAYTEPDTRLNITQIKKAIQGNLCRCTGYRSILQAFQNVSLCNSKAVNDIEDIGKGIQMFESQRTVVPHDMSVLTRIEALIKKLFREKPHSFVGVEFVGHKLTWIRPQSLIELSSHLKKHPAAKIVSGCTSTEYHPQRVSLLKEIIVQIDWLKELHSFEIYENHICIGGGLVIAQLKHHLHHAMQALPISKRRSVKSILCILQRFGSPQIRNSATIGGCLSVDNSASDLQTLANALEWSALYFNPVSQAHSEIKSAFPTHPQSQSIIVNVKIPFTMMNEYTWAYKLSRRRFFDTAILNIASKTQVIPADNADAKIFKINLSFGGSAIKRFSLLFTYGTKPEDLSSELFIKMNNDIQKEISSHLNTHMYSITYISALAKNLLKKLYEYLHDALHPSVSSIHQDPDEMALTQLKATQMIGTTKLKDQIDTDLVWRAIPHESAYKHATGEAVYCDDIPGFKNELFLELVWSKRAHAFLKKVDVSKSLEIEGVVGFISHEDLKDKNMFGIIVKDEEIFASEKVRCVGQLIGALVATTPSKAKLAAELVDIQYIDCHPRILTISDAIGYKSFFDEHSTSLKVGDVDSALENSEHVIADEIKLGGQIHFYMEPQSAIAIPKGEDGEMELIVATQNPAEVQLLVSRTLGISQSKVVVRVKRVGGGFGGKDSRCALVALPCAVAAKKFGKPVRCILERRTDMIISGKREPFLAKYEVGFNSDGRLHAIRMNIYSNAGLSLDASSVSIERAVLNLDNAYHIPNLDVFGVPCKSNKPSNTVFRGPGTVQGSHFIENILDRIAANLNKDPADVRLVNMYKESDYTPYGQLLENSTIRQCWDECIESSSYYERRKEAELYNSTHLYRKRGLYLIPCHFGIGYIYLPLNQAGALVHIYRDGSVLLSIGGVEIGQGLNSKMIQQQENWGFNLQKYEYSKQRQIKSLILVQLQLA